MISFYTSNREITIRNQARVSAYPKVLRFCRFLAVKNRELQPTDPNEADHSIAYQQYSSLPVSLHTENLIGYIQH